MQSFCESFSDHCHAVYYEQRGSKQGNCDIGISEHLRDLKKVVDHYSTESKPIIVGHSWGAMLAILYASAHSSSLQKVIAVSCGPLNKIQGDEFQNELNKRFGEKKEYYDRLWNAIGEEKDEKQQQKLADNYIDRMMEIYQLDFGSGLQIQPHSWDFKGGFNTMSESDQYVSRNEYEKALANIKTPLTVTQGTHDVIHPESIFNLVRKHVSHVETFAIKKAGHYPWIGQGHEQFREILKQQVN